MASDGYRLRIVNYLSKNISKGYNQETLKWALINQGYSRIIVEDALEEVNKELAKKAPVLKEKPEIKYEILDKNNQSIIIKKPWWKRIFR